MALITEDGTGLSAAESLCSVAFATAYHAARGNSAFEALGSDPVREQLLRKATDYLEQMFREQWAGHRINTTQALSWPRYGVPMRDAGSFYASDAVPVIVANACAELALRAISGSLAPDIGRLKSRVKIGPIETEYAAGAAHTRYRAIDQMLLPLLKGSGGMGVKVIRS